MSITGNEFEIVLNNKRIWDFYNENKNIDIETANIMLIDFMENIFLTWITMVRADFEENQIKYDKND